MARVVLLLALLLPAAWAQTVQVQGATFQVAQGTSAFPLCMNNAGAQLQLQPCTPLPSQSWQIGSAAGVQPGTQVMIISPSGGYLCLTTPIILGASSQSSAMSMQACQPGQQNQMFYTQSAPSAQGTTVPILYAVNGACVRPCSDDADIICGYAPGSFPNCNPSSNPFLAVNSGSIQVQNPIVVTTTVGGFNSQTVTEFATSTVTTNSIVTTFEATTQIFPGGDVTITTTITSTPTVTVGATSTTTVSVVVTETVTDFAGEDLGIAGLSRSKQTNAAEPPKRKKSASDGSRELPRLRFSYKEDWSVSDGALWGKLPIWAVGCLAVAAMAVMLTVGAVAVVVRTQLDNPRDHELEGQVLL